MSSKLASLALATTAAAVLLASSSAHADEVVATLARDTPVAAFDGVAAWSEYDQATARYHLVIYQGGQPARARLAASRRPFDVSLGPDARGRVVALYTRCRHGVRDCDVYRYAVKARREQRLGSVSSPEMDEAWPTQWRDRVAFVRRAKSYVRDDFDHRPDPRGKRGGGPLIDCDVPFVKTVGSSEPSRRLDRARCGATTGMSLRGDSLVQVSDAYLYEASETQVRRVPIDGRPARVLARAGGGLSGYSPFSSPSQSKSAVYLTRQGAREPANFLRIDLASRRLTEATPNVPLAGSVAFDEPAGSYWYLQAPERSASQLLGYDPPPFCTQPARSAPLLMQCRLVRATASPFSSTERTLAPRLTLTVNPGDEIVTPPGDLVTVSGDLTRDVVRGDAIVRREPVPAVALELLRNDRSDGSGTYSTTGLTATVDAAGHWTFSLGRRATDGYFVVVARALALASSQVAVMSGAP
jgi:opacity protein-like surface antigen